MPDDPRRGAALTRLTRLAQRQPEAQAWIVEMLERNMPDILETAIAVAEETGAPLPSLLARVLDRTASVAAHEAVARAVPMHATTLQDLAIASIQSLLDQPGWPPAKPAHTAQVRRHALRVALASRLAAASRLAEARSVAEQAVSEAETVLCEDMSARARSIDAYDVIAKCQLSSGDAGGAVETARRALALRQEIADPYRLRADGELQLGLALLSNGLREEACETTTQAVAHARDLVARHRDTLLELSDLAAQLRERGDQQPAVRIAVTMGWDPNGFDIPVVDQGFRLGPLLMLLHSCLTALVEVLETQEPLRADLLAPALSELAASRALMRRGRDDPRLGLRILQLLIRCREIAEISVSTDEFDKMAEEALTANDLELAISVRKAEAEFIRRTEPVDRRALIDALHMQSHLLEDVRPDEAVAAMREAVAVAGNEESLSLAVELHNLSRRLSANSQSREGREVSLRAVRLISEIVLGGGDVPPLILTAMFETLVQRNLECGTEIDFTPPMADAAAKMISDFGRETGADLRRLTHATCGLFDSAMRQGDMTTAQRIGDATSRLAVQRPDDESVQIARGLFASQLLWQAIKRGELDRARSLLSEVIAASRDAPDHDVLTVEHGKCAADLIHAYGQTGNIKAAAQLARDSIGALLSPAYLAARQRDLDADQNKFVEVIRDLARQPESAG
jgi:tetratricopeptide (TPR) repeat protein